MNKNKKIVLSVISLLSFFSIAFWEGVYYFGGLSYLYHSQEIVKETLIFSAIALLALGIFIAVIVMLFKSPKVISIVCTVLLIVAIPVSLFSSFVCMLGLMVGGSKGSSYTEDIANYGKYDEEFNVSYFPEAITDDMTVVDFSYFYKYADTDQTDIYLEVKFDNKKTMDKYLTTAKKAFSEKGVLTYKNPYNPEYTDIVENRWVMHSSEGSFASIIEFGKYESGTKYVDMDYFSITYSYEELTIIYNYTYIGSDIFVGDNPDKGEYYPRFLERFGVEWSQDNEFKYVFKECEKTADITLSEKTSEQELTDVSDNIEDTTESMKTTEQPQQTEKTEQTQKKAIFNTENIARITFYAYGGNGKGSEVPEENMTEIINWLGSFTVDKEVVGEILPGTNTRQVEIEYTDGTVIKQGLDVVVIDGIRYHMESDKKPDCFEEIMSKTSYK